MKKVASALCALGIFGALLFPASSFAVSASSTKPADTLATLGIEGRSEVFIDKEKNVRIGAAKIVLVAGTTFFTRLIWGQSFIRLTVKTASTTQFVNLYGEPIEVSRIKVGDYVNIAGELDSSGSDFLLLAKKIINTSNKTEQNQFSGTVSELAPATQSFTLSTKLKGNVIVDIGTTTEIKKGSRIIPLTSLKGGDVVSDVRGVFDHSTNRMKATTVTVYINMKAFVPQIFQGILKSIDTVATPAKFTVIVGEKLYTVQLTSNAKILRKDKSAISLSRFEIGDTVRFYGKIEERDDPFITAEVIRNLNI